MAQRGTVQPRVPPSHPQSSPKTPDSTRLHGGRGLPLPWWAPPRSSTTLRSCFVPLFPHGGSPSPPWGCGWAPGAPRAALAPMAAQHTPRGRAVPIHAGPAASTAGPAGTAAAALRKLRHGTAGLTPPSPARAGTSGLGRHGTSCDVGRGHRARESRQGPLSISSPGHGHREQSPEVPQAGQGTHGHPVLRPTERGCRTPQDWGAQRGDNGPQLPRSGQEEPGGLC